MKILVTSLIALGFAAVALAVLLADSYSSAPDEPAPVLPAVSSADLLDRIESLSQETRELRRRLSQSELQAPSPQRIPLADGFVSKEDFDAFREEVRAALAGGNGPAAKASPESPEFVDQVASTLSRIRKDEAAAKVEARHQARVDRLDDRMANLETKLGLTSPQSSALRSAFQAQYARDADLERRWREGEDTAVLGEVKSSNFQAHRSELAEILTPEQIEMYRATQRDRGGKD